MLTKRRSNRNLRLSISSAGTIRLSMPYWTPYSAGIIFINKHQKWVQRHRLNARPLDSVEENKLRQQAQSQLPPRVQHYSKSLKLPYEKLRIKKMTSRWGSCSNKRNISLSYYLVKLPIELIDYVIIHELAHTKHPNHSKGFWKFMDECLPDVKERKKMIRKYRPARL